MCATTAGQRQLDRKRWLPAHKPDGQTQGNSNHEPFNQHRGRRTRAAPRQGWRRFARHQRQLPRTVRLLSIRLLRHLHFEGIFSVKQRVHLADVDVCRVRRGLPDAAVRRHRAWRLYRQSRPPQGADRDAVAHG